MRKLESVGEREKVIIVLVVVVIALLSWFLEWALFDTDGIWHDWLLRSCGVQPWCDWCGRELEESFKDPLRGRSICRDCYETVFSNHSTK